VLLGANGAGKTTALKAISGLLKTELGEVTRGTILYGDKRIDGLDVEEIARMGIVQVMEGRRIFGQLTVEEDLRVGMQGRSGNIRDAFDTVYGYFPILKNLRNRIGGYLSGGEQQMLVIGRALMGAPRVMLLDEPSLGLAPKLVEQIFQIIRRINVEQKVSILLVEQNALVALSVATHGYVMENGRIVLSGTGDDLKKNEDVKEFYLGLAQGGTKKSYREVKHYRRRKRWLG
jgi:branched-chain amino acid transport system ATP-binding protein